MKASYKSATVLLALQTQLTHAQIPLIDTNTALVPMESYTAPVSSSADSFYPSDYRVLDCWQCFEARGRMCIDTSASNLFLFTRSSDFGKAFCCKPDSVGGYCESGARVRDEQSGQEIEMICSPESDGSG